MYTYRWLLILFCNAIVASNVSAQFLRVCHFLAEAVYRGNRAKHNIKDIDPFLCTHLVYTYAFFNPLTDRIEAYQGKAEDGPNGRFSKFNALKLANPALKTLLAVRMSATDIATLLLSEKRRSNFTSSVAEYVVEEQFDGLSIFWLGSNPFLRNTLTDLLQALRWGFDKASDTHLILNLNLDIPSAPVTDLYVIPELIKYADFLTVMAFSIEHENTDKAIFECPLYPAPNADISRCMNYTIHMWHASGLTFNHMVVGISGKGYNFELVDTSVIRPGSPIYPERTPVSPFYFLPGRMAFSEICHVLVERTGVRHFDTVQKCPYVVHGPYWTGYEDTESLGFKLDLLIPLGVQGLAFHTMDDDDFSGHQCMNGTYPLLSFIKRKSLEMVPLVSPGDINQLDCHGWALVVLVLLPGFLRCSRTLFCE